MPRPGRFATRATTALLAATALWLAGCENKADVAAAPAAAKVNGEAIPLSQVEQLLQQQRLKPEQADAASRQLLQRLVEQQLAQQKAVELKLDREPRVVQQLEAARREVLARAYFDKVGEAAAKPTAQEVAAFYQANPALFEQRRIYNLQEIDIEARPEQVAALKAQLEQAKNVNALVEYLKANGLRFNAAQAVRSAEQLPTASLGTFAAMKDGQAVLNATPSGAQLIVLAGSRAQPVTLEQAAPAIEQFLLNARKRELVAKDLKALRDAARIEYLGKYADAASAAATGAAAASPTFAPAAADEASAAHK
ncbi:MAG TPA: EpsD family peptidyl-prolyl cis-trans isomerase [Rubrivivax sp.]|nr:EpsD family peptidyl-prolyl cis-trans isomerase [Rubrivivax sp.]